MVTSNNMHDDRVGTTKGNVNQATPMPILAPPNAGNDPFLNHPTIPTVADFGSDPGND